MKLYEITWAIERLSTLEDAGDFEAALDALQPMFEEKAEGIIKLVRNIEAEADAYAEEARRMAAAGKARDNRARRLKDYLKENMERLGKDKVGGLLWATLQKSPPRCTVTDEKMIPALFREQVPTWVIDQKGIIEKWRRDGEQVNGTIVEQGNHIKIWPKKG